VHDEEQIEQVDEIAKGEETARKLIISWYRKLSSSFFSQLQITTTTVIG
jgi:hypothetical protein